MLSWCLNVPDRCRVCVRLAASPVPAGMTPVPSAGNMPVSHHIISHHVRTDKRLHTCRGVECVLTARNRRKFIYKISDQSQHSPRNSMTAATASSSFLNCSANLTSTSPSAVTWRHMTTHKKAWRKYSTSKKIEEAEGDVG